MSPAENNMGMRLEARLQQKLVLTPQLQQAIKLLLLSRIELNQVINQELLENPLLEESVADVAEETPAVLPDDEVQDTTEQVGPSEFDLKWENYYVDDDWGEREDAPASEELPSYEQTLSKQVSLVDHLLWQLSLSAVTEKEKEIGTFLVGNLDEDGYLRVSIEEIASSAGVPVELVEEALKMVQKFDPAGVGARDIKECLLIQVAQLGLSGSLVETIIQGHLELLEWKAYQKIATNCNVSLKEVLAAVKIIEHLEPKPGRPYGPDGNISMIPDVFVVKSEGRYTVLLNDDGLPKLKISSYYRNMLRSKETMSEGTKSYMDDKFRSALWLVRSIEQRNRTIRRVAESIVKFQYDFMERGVRYLKPLILRQVARDVSMHESTISRVTTNKCMLTPQGIYDLKFFFNNSLPRSGHDAEDFSSVVVREMIKKMVSEEDPSHPLKDQEIVAHLKGESIEIARRTVAKYRVTLKIPSSKRRKSLNA